MNKKLLPALQGLRVLATLGIFLFHSGFLINRTFPVTLFFMLSGFMVYYTKSSLDGYETYGKWIKGYWFKKIKQFYPLHLFMFAFSVMIRGGIKGKEIHARCLLMKQCAIFCE